MKLRILIHRQYIVDTCEMTAPLYVLMKGILPNGLLCRCNYNERVVGVDDRRKHFMQIEMKDRQALRVYRSRILVRPILGLATGLAGIVNMMAAILPKPNWDMFLGAWPVDTHHGEY